MTAEPRRVLLALVALGLAGTGTELFLIGHYEEAWQVAPLVLIGLSLAAVVWHAVRGTTASLKALRVAMALLVAGGLAGLCLHFTGSLAFQRELNPSGSLWTLVAKSVRAQAPPALAPAALTQLGLLGLLYGYRPRPSVAEGSPSEGA